MVEFNPPTFDWSCTSVGRKRESKLQFFSTEWHKWKDWTRCIFRFSNFSTKLHISLLFKREKKIKKISFNASLITYTFEAFNSAVFIILSLHVRNVTASGRHCEIKTYCPTLQNTLSTNQRLPFALIIIACLVIDNNESNFFQNQGNSLCEKVLVWCCGNTSTFKCTSYVHVRKSEVGHNPTGLS